jgi:cytochrome d ubiquinol oxidase subunit I
MHFDVVILARLQFALTVMFHYLFPPLTIGLGGLLVIMEVLWLRSRDPQYKAMARFWTKIFALNFALGVATGIVMEFEFGTNWAAYSRYVGDVFGPLLVFGWDRISPRMHLFATCMVALGATLSAVWIVVANSWQQTPAGFHIVGQGLGGRAEITDFWAMVFNPSSMIRLTHTLIGAYILAAFFVMGVSAYYLLKGRHLEFAKKSFTIALIVGVPAALSALASGHLHGQNTAKYQPAKLAAMEAIFQTENSTPLYVFGLPDADARRVKCGIAVPGLASFLAHNNFRDPVAGLDKFPRNEWAPVLPTFLSFHIMVWLGLFFIAVTLLAAFLRWRGTLFDTRWLLRLFVLVIPLPYLSNQLGWCTTELGRQPWVVYGLLRTCDAVSKAVASGQVLFSIVLFGLIYLLLFAVWLHVMTDKIKRGPEEPAT